MTRIEINLPAHLDYPPEVPKISAPPPIPTLPQVPSTPSRGWGWLFGIAAGILLVFTGMMVLFYGALRDYEDIAGKPWSSAFILFEIPDNLPVLEQYPVQVRRVHRPNPLEDDITLKLLEKVVSWERFDQPLRLSDPELLIALDLTAEKLTPLLASGRLPEPGKPEVLAGSLARDEGFWVDDVEFTVTGRLADSVSGFLFSYMLPHSSEFAHLFPDEPQTATGLLVVFNDPLMAVDYLPQNPHLAGQEPEVIADTESDKEPAAQNIDTVSAAAEESLVLPAYAGGMLLSQKLVTRISIFGLLLTALGGTLGFFSLFRILHSIRYRLLFGILDMMVARPVLYWGIHVVFYGVFFFSMLESINNPLLTYRITQYIQAVFSEGGLGYIGAAYASGDVIHAAWATFYNNYIEQTLGLTFLISLFPIPFGLLKNLMSFSLVGGALAPLWAGTSQAYILHSITMILELQSYIIACFAITAWPLHLIKGLWMGQFLAYIKSGLIMLFTAAMLTGAMLGVAALYEAFTLIHLMGS